MIVININAFKELAEKYIDTLEEEREEYYDSEKGRAREVLNGFMCEVYQKHDSTIKAINDKLDKISEEARLLKGQRLEIQKKYTMGE